MITQRCGGVPGGDGELGAGCAPGTEWIKFTKRELPKEEGVYTSLMDELSVSPMLSLPGRENIDLVPLEEAVGKLKTVPPKRYANAQALFG